MERAGMPMMNLPSMRHLRHLTALADHRHFGRAADACAVTQSTLSASIKVLEDLLQATLVDRSRPSVVLTPVGHETVERARKIIADCEALAHAARKSPALPAGMPRTRAWRYDTSAGGLSV
jgi:LysR family transcriptional regulator, hydrogen peroxide-inducible genes activator